MKAAPLILLLLLVAPPVRAQVPDLDGDGIPNVLEINGYFYDVTNGLTACDPAVDVPCFVTDYQQWSTDGDPFSDFDEISQANLPIAAPYSHPLVAAEHIIAVELVRYAVVPRQTITDARGGSFTQGYETTTSSEYQESISVTSTASVGPGGLAGYEATGTVTETTAHSTSTSRTWEVDWNTATTIDLNQAADLHLAIHVRNEGGAPARNVRLFFNLKIGHEVIASIRAPEVPGLLDAGQRYPTTQQGPWLITQVEAPDGSTAPITLTMDQLKAIESGVPLSLVVTAVEADILRWNPDGGGGGGSWSCDEGVSCDWNSYVSRIKASTIKLDVQVGDARRQYRVFGGKDYANPSDPDIVMTLRDALDLVLDVDGPNENATIEGRPYPADWYAMTSSDALVQAWEDAGAPQNLLGLRLEPGTDLRLNSPGADPAPIVDLATYAPDLRHVYVSARAAGGFPIREVTAHVTIGGQEQTVVLELDNGAFYTNPRPFVDPAAAGGQVTVTNARGDATTRTLSLPVSESQTCGDIEAAYALVTSGEYIVFQHGDVSRPMRAYCRFYPDAAPDTYFWIDRTPSFVDDWGGSFLGVTFVDEETAFAVGAAPGRVPILRTRDGGATWDSVTVLNRGLEDPALYDVAFDDAGQTGLAVGFSYDGDSQGYAIFRTTNGGATWVGQASFPVLSSHPSFRHVAHAGGGRWFVGGGARFMRSDDDGQTWTPVTSPDIPWQEPNVSAIVFREDGTGLALIGGSLFITRDRGDTWSLHRAFDEEFVLNFLSYAGNDTWYGGLGHNNPYTALVYRSTDDGLTWERIANVADAGAGSMQEMAFVTPDVGFVFDRIYDVDTQRYYGSVWRTEDSGASWTAERLMDGGEPRGIAMLDANRGIIASTNGVLITTSGGGNPLFSTSTAAQGPGVTAEVPRTATLLPNYPNPFNPTTTLAFELDRTREVRLEVFDLLGRHVATLVDGLQPAGRHAVRFDARGLASGVYVYRLAAGAVVETRTMLLLR